MSASDQNFPFPTGTVRDGAYVDVYSNQVRLGVTISDITIVFGLMEDAGPNQIVNKDKVAVHLAPTSAKSLMMHLKAAVEAYEKGAGEIPIPYSVLGSVASIIQLVPAMLRDQISAPESKS